MAGILALVLLILALVSQGSHQVFQISRPAADYAMLLLPRSATLKAELGIDFIFVCVYGATFIALATTLAEWARGKGDSAFSAVFGWGGAAALVVTALLDAIENAHILSLLAMAEPGQLIAQSSIATQIGSKPGQIRSQLLRTVSSVICASRGKPSREAARFQPEMAAIAAGRQHLCRAA